MESKSPTEIFNFARGNRRCWWIPAKSSVGDFTKSESELFTLTVNNPKLGTSRRGFENIREVEPGDLLIGYVANRKKQIAAILRITKALGNRETIEFRVMKLLTNPPKWDDLRSRPELSQAKWPTDEQGFRFLRRVPDHIADALLKVIGGQSFVANPVNASGGALPSATTETANVITAPIETSNEVAVTSESPNDDGASDAIDDLRTHESELIDISDETEREEVRKSRIGQGKFRKDLIKYWKGRCAVTECSEQRILRASHIKPWRDCETKTGRERLDQFNGLLLAPHLDALFDAGLISFDDSGRIVRSPELSADDQRLLGVNDELALRSVDDRHKEYLRFHRENRLRPRPTTQTLIRESPESST